MRATIGLILLAACGRPVDEPHWSDQLVPDSPCYEVDLLDGLDESSTDELRSVYECVNLHGHVEPLGSTVDALETARTREGRFAGLDLAVAINHLSEVDVDPFAIAGLLVEALRDPEIDPVVFVDVGIELIHGRAATDVRDGTVDPGDLSDSLLTPLGPALVPAITVLLDDQLEAVVWLGGLLRDPETDRWLRTITAYLESDEPAITAPLDRALPNVGQAIGAAASPGNDRWDGATGHSLRDAADVLLVREVDPVLQVMAPHLAPIVDDPLAMQALEDELVRLHGIGALQATPGQLAWMVGVDEHGAPLTDPNEPSALFRFMRLLSSANRPMDCTIDLWITTIDWSFGNLAVTVLEILADLDPDTAQGTVEIIAILTDNVAADWMLHEAVDLGVCPTLTHDLVDDLVAVDVLTRPEADDLLDVVVGLLSVVKDGGASNHVPELADALASAHDVGATEPIEEVLRDVGGLPLVADVVALLPVLADPAGWGITAAGGEPTDLADFLDLVAWAFVVDPDDGRTGLERFHPLLRAVMAQDGTWTALDRAGGLLRQEGTALSRLLDLLPAMLALDPELDLVHQIGAALDHTSVSAPLLRALEAPGVVDALFDDTTGSTEPPLGFVGRLLADGTFDDVLAVVDLVMGPTP